MKFKKHISILVTFFLLVSNLGLAFNVHYCGDTIASVTVGTVSNSEADCCGAIEKESKCCNDKIIKAEPKSDQLVMKNGSFEPNVLPVYNDWSPVLFAAVPHYKTRENTTYYCDANAPPLYLLYSQYTLYA
ncbi:MAG: hypothetical protein RL427_742 [Bacteroidota bacterium]|jgi:hypothetical protein